jgi:hypothetical protein
VGRARRRWVGAAVGIAAATGRAALPGSAAAGRPGAGMAATGCSGSMRGRPAAAISSSASRAATTSPAAHHASGRRSTGSRQAGGWRRRGDFGTAWRWARRAPQRRDGAPLDPPGPRRGLVAVRSSRVRGGRSQVVVRGRARRDRAAAGRVDEDDRVANAHSAQRHHPGSATKPTGAWNCSRAVASTAAPPRPTATAGPASAAAPIPGRAPC